MFHVWLKLTDIIVLSAGSDGWIVRINDSDGLIYVGRDAWTFMINVLPDTSVAEEQWVSVGTLLLAAHGELGCGLSHFQEKWWVSRRYCSLHGQDVPDSVVAELSQQITQQFSLASFVAKWPSLMRKGASDSHSLALSVLK